VLAFLAVAAMALLGQDGAEPAGRAASCRLRVYVAATGLSEEQLDIARLQVEQIWGRYGVSFEWPAAPPGPRPSGPGVLRVWLTRDGIPGGPSGRLVFAGPGQPGDCIRVTAGADRLLAATRFRESTLARATRLVQDRFVAVALGRMTAHEIAHYLLATPRHAERGLLRAHFSTSDFLTEDLSRYRLDEAEIRGIAPSSCLPPEGPALTIVAAKP
jgi:hypothetical protein